MVFLYCPNPEFALNHRFDCQGSGSGACKGGRIGDIKCEGRTPDGEGLGHGLLVAGGVNDKINFPVFDHVHHMGPSLSYLVHHPVWDSVVSEELRGPLSGQDLKSQAVKAGGGIQHGHLVIILDTDKHPP